MQFDLLAELAPPAAAPGGAAAPLQLLLDAAYEQIQRDTPFRTPGQAITWATEVTGIPYAPGGPWTLDDVYDAVEGAAHRSLAPALSGLPFPERLLRTRECEEAWFHGRALTDAARAQAQFSTPLPIAESAAHLVASAAGLGTLLEPCAGTGSLVRPLLFNPRLHLRVNETDPRRRKVLSWLGLEPGARDALRLPLDPLRVDAVLSNPPFGAIARGHAGRGATDFALTNVAQRFAAAHLHSLTPGSGILVALLPASTLSDAGAGFRRWLDDRHTPLLFLGCPPGSYRTRGALRDAMLLVAVRGRTIEGERVVVPQPDWEEWADVVEATAARLAAAFPARAAAAAIPASHGGAAVAIHPAAVPGQSAVPVQQPACPSPVPHEAPADAAPAEACEPAEPAAQASAAAPAAPVSPNAPRVLSVTPLAIDFGSTPAARAIPDWEREVRERAEAEASPVFTPFVISLAERRAPHPRLVVQTRSMAGMPPPPLLRQGFESPLADDAWGRAGSAGGASDEQAELSLRVLDAWDRRHGFLCADDVGVGKAQPLGARVLTPTGWTTMGALRAGDRVIAGDGQPTVVTGVYDRGEREVFRVTFSDGASTECCNEHLWLTRTELERNNARRGYPAPGKVRALAEIRRTLHARPGGQNRNHSIPIVGAVAFDAREVPVDPYVLGALLGDGCLREANITVTTADPPIRDMIAARLPPGITLSQYRPLQYSVSAGRRSRRPNAVLDGVRELGLTGVGAEEKFVPDLYKFNSPEVRLGVLRGLLDTDGSVNASGTSTVFYSVSRQLAEDVRFLAQSFGGTATINMKSPWYSHRGERRRGQDCYVVVLRMPPDVNPFALPRKADRVRPKSKYLPCRLITAVEPVGTKAVRCISVAHPSHLYVTDDLIVTHNTRELALLVLEAVHEGETRILVTTKNETNVRDLEAELRRVASGDEHGPFPAQLVEVSNYVEAKGEHGVLPRPHGPAVYLAHSYNFADFAPALAAVSPTVWLADEAHEYANIADSKRGLAWASLHETMLAYTSKFAYFTATPAVTLDQLCYLYGLRQWPVGAFDLWLARKTGTGKPPKEGDEAASARAVQAHVRESAALGDTAGVDADQAAKEGKKRFMARRNDAFVIRTTPAETEQVMRELQASGHYMSRDLWRGGVTFEVEWVDLLGDPEARRRYDEAAEVCRDLTRASRQFAAMNQEVKTQGLDRAMVQSYLKQLLFDLRLDAVLAQADAALAEGHQVVISVHSVAGDEDDVAALGSDAQEHAVNRRLESAINRINVREVAKERTSGNETVFRDLGEIPEALLARESLRERARALPRLRDPVRVVSQHFGASRVAAITGRIPARLRTQRMGDFQAGTRQVALISRAGKVGISLHDTNGRPRTMLVADYEWSADLFKQELGRVDRTGQLSAPSIVLMASTAAGERKFASTIAARMASLGATCKGSAEATGTDALDVFDMAGGLALEAMRNTVQAMEPGQRAYFTGSQFVERQVTRSGATVWTPKHRPEEGTQMRHFLLEMLLFPLQESHVLLAAWEEQRDGLLTFETLEALAARRTGRVRGVVLRERALPVAPPMGLVDVEYEDGEQGVIAQGFVTEHMVRIQQARGPDSNGNPRTRRYLQFTGTDGQLRSGLDLTTSEAHRIRWAFGAGGARDLTPEALLQDLRTGEKVVIQGARGARWMLHLRRDGRIEIRGAKLSSDRTHLMRPSLAGAVAYEAVGNFFHLTSQDALGPFLEHFPAGDDALAIAAAA